MNNPLTLTQASKIAGCNPSSLRYAILRGDLPAAKFGKTWLVEESHLREWLAVPENHKRGKKKKPPLPIG